MKTQLFGKHHIFHHFLILPLICSQKLKDSQSRLMNSSIVMVSPPRSQEKRWLILPHFPLSTYRYMIPRTGFGGGDRSRNAAKMRVHSSRAHRLSHSLKICIRHRLHGSDSLQVSAITCTPFQRPWSNPAGEKYPYLFTM